MRHFLLLILNACLFFPAFSEGVESFHLSGEDSVAFEGYKQSGIAMFSKKDYANAIHYLEKAYELNRWEWVLQETLYFSYLYMNRDFEARQFYYALSPESRSAYHLQKPKILTSAYVEGGILGSIESDYKIPDVTYYKEVAEPHMGQSYTARLSHDVLDWISASHGVSYTYSEACQRVDSVGTNIFSGDISTKNISYTLELPIHLGKGWTVTPAAYVSYVSSQYYQVLYDTTSTTNTNVNPYDPWHWGTGGTEGAGYLRQGWNGYPYNPYPYYNTIPTYANSMYGYGYGGYYTPMWWSWGWNMPWLWGDSYAYKFERVENHVISYAFDLDIAKIYRHSEYSAALTYLRNGEIDVWKASAQWLWYPKGNLDFYSLLRASYLMRERKAENDIVAEGLVGFKVANWLWWEVGGLVGNMNGHSDRNLGVVYALQPKTDYRIVSNWIFPVSEHLGVSLLYRFTQSESSVYYAPTVDTIEIEHYPIYGNNLFLGVKWTF
ncbi:MAG: hypothetical protein J6Y37_09860 [Paludibacteraceae bacterium]|nr:hypothetical protein [Paludibacteraceae bacterium]